MTHPPVVDGRVLNNREAYEALVENYLDSYGKPFDEKRFEKGWILMEYLGEDITHMASNEAQERYHNRKVDDEIQGRD